MKTFNPWANLQRITEIALLSREKIRPVSDSPIHQIFHTEIKRLFEGSPIRHEDLFSKDGEIYLHLVEPRYCPEYDLTPKIELDINLAMSKRFRSNPKPVNYDPFASSTMVHACNDYLQKFIQHNNVTKKDMEFIYSVSSFIAWLDNEPNVQLEHIIEASFYRSKEDATYNLIE